MDLIRAELTFIGAERSMECETCIDAEIEKCRHILADDSKEISGKMAGTRDIMESEGLSTKLKRD